MQPVIENEPSYVFNTREFKENSVILSVLTLNYGVVSVMARGNSARSILQPFTPLKLSLNPSKTDLYFLADYECCGETYNFKLPILFCATYLNELLYNLYHTKEANPLLFGTYVATLDALQQQKHIEQHLRLFELTLLESLGYGLSPLDQNGQPLEAKQLYRFGIGMGFIPINTPQPASSSKQAFLRTISELNAASSTPLQGSAQSPSQSPAHGSVTAPAPTATLASAESLANTANTANNVNAAPQPETGNTAITANTAELNPASRWSDEELEDAMRFSKHKVKGPKLEMRRSSSGFDASQNSGVTTPDGRPIRLSELLGPALSGAVLARIVKRNFDSDTLKQSKQLTTALFQFLLGKREIKSRQLYKDYLQLQAQGKASGATSTAMSSNAQTLNPHQASASLSVTATALASGLVSGAGSSSGSNSSSDSIPSNVGLTSSPNAHTASKTMGQPITANTANTAYEADKATVSKPGNAQDAKEVCLIEAGKVLQDKSALVEAALKEEQLQQAAQKKSRRKTQAKSKVNKTGQASASEVEDSSVGKAEMAKKSKIDEAKVKESKQAKALPGDVQLEPSAGLLESAAKAQAALVSKLEADKAEKLAKKRKSRASATKTNKPTQDITQVKDSAGAQDKT